MKGKHSYSGRTRGSNKRHPTPKSDGTGTSNHPSKAESIGGKKSQAPRRANKY